MAIEIWILIFLRANRGITFEYILNKMPRGKFEWFVDASTSWGIGGCCGEHYFMIKNEALVDFFGIYDQNYKNDMSTPGSRVPIAYIELLAALFAIAVFSNLCAGTLVRLNSDNTGVVSWLRKGRCREGLGFKMLSAIELIKRRECIKISAYHVRGTNNSSADQLSRGGVPEWLQRRGWKIDPLIEDIFELLTNPITSWREMLTEEK